MKTNGKKAIIATMAIAMAAGIAGSISGTVAWFQYNTRVTSEFTGTTAKCTEFLQVRTVIPGNTTTYGAWGTTLTNADINQAAGRANDNLAPITIPGATQAAALPEKYGNPVAGYDTYDKWEFADKADYMEFDLQFRVLDIDGETVAAGSEAMLAQALYLTDISVAQLTVAGKQDISSAVRVHIAKGTEKYALLAPGDASAATVTTNTHGALDLGGAVGYDTNRDVPSNYSWSANADRLLDYGSNKPTQVAYNMNKKMAAGDSNGLYPRNDGKGALSEGTPFGNTIANTSGTAFADANYFTLHFVIWLEGWQGLGNVDASEATYSYFLASAPTAEVGANGDKAVYNGKVYTKAADAWDAGVDITANKNYTVDGGLYTFNGTNWTVASNTIWDAEDYIGARFNIGMSFGVTTLAYAPYNA